MEKYIKETLDYLNLKGIVAADIGIVLGTGLGQLIENIENRFPEEEMLSAFSVLAMRPLSMFNAKDRAEYGNEEIEELWDFYGKEQVVRNKDSNDNMVEVRSAAKLGTLKEVLAEWKEVKEIVIAGKYARDNLATLWQMIAHYHPNFVNMIFLAQLALTSAVHTAGCERGFSVQNRILTKKRNRLNVGTQDKLIKVQLEGKSIDIEEALKIWKGRKERRIYELK